VRGEGESENRGNGGVERWGSEPGGGGTVKRGNRGMEKRRVASGNRKGEGGHRCEGIVMRAWEATCRIWPGEDAAGRC